MASNYYKEQDSDGSNNEDSDSGYLITDQIPRVRPIEGTRLNTVEDMINELDIYKRANEQLRAQIFRLNRRVITSEQKFRKERTKKDNNKQQAMVIENMHKSNASLLVKIKDYQTTIKVLEMNEKELQQKIATFKDEKTKKLIESESKKTEDNEKELRDLKQRLQDLETELEEKNDIIAMKMSEDNKVSETLERNTKEVKEVKAEMTKMAQNVDNMKQTMNHILSAVQSLGNDSPNEPGREDKTTSNYHDDTIKKEEIDSGLLAGATNTDDSAKSTRNGKQQTEMSGSRERVTKLPPLVNKRSTSSNKPPWHHTGGADEEQVVFLLITN